MIGLLIYYTFSAEPDFTLLILEQSNQSDFRAKFTVYV